MQFCHSTCRRHSGWLGITVRKIMTPVIKHQLKFDYRIKIGDHISVAYFAGMYYFLRLNSTRHQFHNPELPNVAKTNCRSLFDFYGPDSHSICISRRIAATAFDTIVVCKLIFFIITTSSVKIKDQHLRCSRIISRVIQSR